MKDIYKNPTLYYILVPIVAALWPLLVRVVYLPNVEDNWNAKKTQYDKAQKVITQILTLDPGRLDFADSKAGNAEFDYTTAVDNVAGLCEISAADYKISSKPIRAKRGQKSQSANVTLKEVDITKFARFLSSLQLRWGNLQCETVKLTKHKGVPDRWTVDIKFKYYY